MINQLLEIAAPHDGMTATTWSEFRAKVIDPLWRELRTMSPPGYEFMDMYREAMRSGLIDEQPTCYRLDVARANHWVGALRRSGQLHTLHA